MANILVIEDQEPLGQLYRSVLRQFNHNVILAINGEEGIEAAVKESPDLVVLDLLLPGIPGMEVARRLREAGILPRTPLIITTALGDVDAREIAESLDATALLSKPFSISTMIHAVQTALPGSEGTTLVS